jgi:hypothetical protein
MKLERERVDCIHMAQDMCRWRALVNRAMNLGFHKKREISCLAERVHASRGEFCSIASVHYHIN